MALYLPLERDLGEYGPMRAKLSLVAVNCQASPTNRPWMSPWDWRPVWRCCVTRNLYRKVEVGAMIRWRREERRSTEKKMSDAPAISMPRAEKT